jgi:hypothetical protein
MRITTKGEGPAAEKLASGNEQSVIGNNRQERHRQIRDMGRMTR